MVRFAIFTQITSMTDKKKQKKRRINCRSRPHVVPVVVGSSFVSQFFSMSESSDDFLILYSDFITNTHTNIHVKKCEHMDILVAASGYRYCRK